MTIEIFKIGDKVQSKSEPSKLGTILGTAPSYAGLDYYKVIWHSLEGEQNVASIDLTKHLSTKNPLDNLIANSLGNHQDFQRLITYFRMIRKFPLNNQVYAFNASRTKFYPYQFKPLIKIMSSYNNRLMICDEVGLGKTIEAGLILTEFKARQAMDRVLVVCPAPLREKWKDELKRRFNEDAVIYDRKGFDELLNTYADDPDRTNFFGIISLESIRADSIINKLESIHPNIDMVIVDEAHHMRNFGRKSREIGKKLSECSDAMIFLTATPIHLGEENLFSLLNLLDEEDFPDKNTAQERFDANEPIVKAQSILSKHPPDMKFLYETLSLSKNSSWFNNNSFFIDFLEEVKSLINNSEAISFSKAYELQTKLSDLNLLGHLFTRTRKRDVHTHTAKRKAQPIRLEFSDIEKRFYNTVTELVKHEACLKYKNKIIINWLLNLPQRRLASSIPAMIEHYRNSNDSRDDIEESEWFEDDEGQLTYEEKTKLVLDLKDKLNKIILEWDVSLTDTKFEEFYKTIVELKKKEGKIKCLVFAFFKATLRYLYRKLQEKGIEVALISGDVNQQERHKIVQKFKESNDIEILLSSKVGSEGLDFQFCDILFNYDFPWNPMEVEQRIGRIDRIGQESPVIRIYNLWIKDTIEDKILNRLYERIGIFEKSIGDLEVILGDIFKKIENEFLSKNLSEEEQQQKLEEALTIINRKKIDLEKLDQDSANFIGTDAFFEEEVKSICKKKRYITGEQIRIFLQDFIKNNFPLTKIEYDHKKKIGILSPDDKLQKFIISNGKSRELRHFIYNNSKVTFTLDNETAFQNPNIEFLSILHPLIIAIVEYYQQKEKEIPNAHHIVLNSNDIEDGFYFYYIFRLSISGGKNSNHLEFVLINKDFNVLSLEQGESLMAEMIERGQNNMGQSLNIPEEFVKKTYNCAEKQIQEHINDLREKKIAEAKHFCERRLTSINLSYTKILEKKKELLYKAKEKQQSEKYIKMLEGTINRLNKEWDIERTKVEKRKSVEFSYDLIANGILEIISNE
jgi:superfamily II DNA or RNA helicase